MSGRSQVCAGASYPQTPEELQKRILEDQKRQLNEIEIKQDRIFVYVNIILAIFVIGILIVVIWWLVNFITSWTSGQPTSSICNNSNPDGTCANIGTVCALNVTGNYECLKRCSIAVPCQDGSICEFSNGKQVCLPFY